ncbi:hypothetical protein, partial [Kingella oralis]|uniref:hypothetical protein n=1 Tax=Kingella oralis TaxID=505 RepID=UPI0034E53C83
ALAWHARGQRFDPAYLHHKNKNENPSRNGWDFFVCEILCFICPRQPEIFMQRRNRWRGKLNKAALISKMSASRRRSIAAQ